MTVSYGHHIEKIATYGLICPVCDDPVDIDIYLERWTSSDDGFRPMARISAPHAHACIGDHE